MTLLPGAAQHWCGTSSAAVNEPGICLHPEEHVAGASGMVMCVRLGSSALDVLPGLAGPARLHVVALCCCLVALLQPWVAGAW